MEKDTFYVNLKGEYFYDDKNKTVTFSFGGKPVVIKTEQILFYSAGDKNSSEIEFLIAFTKKEFKSISQFIPAPTLMIKGGKGNDFVPPKGGTHIPPKDMPLKNVKAFKLL